MSIDDSATCSLLATCLHKLYEADILDEEVILKWFSKPHQLNEFEFPDAERKRKELREYPVSSIIKMMQFIFCSIYIYIIYIYN